MGYIGRKETMGSLKDHLPCKECIVSSTCTKSWAKGTACDELWEKTKERILKRKEAILKSKEKNENKN